MAWFLGWCLLAGILTWILRRVFRRAPFHGVPEDAMRFYLRLQEELAERHTDVTIVGLTGQGFGAVLRVERQELSIPLSEVFLRGRAFPDAFAETVDRLVAELRQHLASVGDVPFDEAVHSLLPQIRSEEWVRANSPAFGPGRILQAPLLEDLVTCYVLDEAGSYVFVTEGHLNAWGTQQDYVANLAMANLQRLAAETGGLPIPARDETEPRVLHTGDGYDAARVLLALQDDALERTEGLVFAIPDRDTLVVGRKGDGLARLMAGVGAEFATCPHPISPRVFEVDKGRLTVTAPGRDLGSRSEAGPGC